MSKLKVDFALLAHQPGPHAAFVFAFCLGVGAVLFQVQKFIHFEGIARVPFVADGYGDDAERVPHRGISVVGQRPHQGRRGGVSPVFGTSFAVGQPNGRAVLGDVLDVGCCAQAVFVTLSCAS